MSRRATSAEPSLFSALPPPAATVSTPHTRPPPPKPPAPPVRLVRPAQPAQLTVGKDGWIYLNARGDGRCFRTEALALAFLRGEGVAP